MAHSCHDTNKLQHKQKKPNSTNQNSSVKVLFISVCSVTHNMNGELDDNLESGGDVKEASEEGLTRYSFC